MKTINLITSLLFFILLTACNLPLSSPAQANSPAPNTQLISPSTTSIPTTSVPQINEGLETTLTSSPFPPTATVEEMRETPIPDTQSLIITIVYDNNPSDPRLGTAWGFSALIEYHGHTLLFDTGGEGPLLMENMRTLGIDPMRFESVVLSHAHDDHTAGLPALLKTGVKPVVYLLPSFPSVYKARVKQSTQMVKVSPGQSIVEGIWTTGEMGRDIPEQALVIHTDQGLVVITGCAHPGIVSIVEKAREMRNEPVRLVLGGFHLGGASQAQIEAILKDFRRLKVKQVAPCHCTGDQAISMFANEYGKDFIQLGAGSIIHLEAID